MLNSPKNKMQLFHFGACLKTFLVVYLNTILNHDTKLEGDSKCG